MENEVVIDATGHIMGRLASVVAKLLLNGKKVHVVNVENCYISGNRRSVIDEWKAFFNVKSRIHPRHTPKHHKRPDRIFTRVVRGMLPRNKPRGRQALKRLRTYHGIPEQLRGKKLLKVEDALARRPRPFYLTLGELAKELGWKG